MAQRFGCTASAPRTCLGEALPVWPCGLRAKPPRRNAAWMEPAPRRRSGPRRRGDFADPARHWTIGGPAPIRPRMMGRFVILIRITCPAL